MALKLADMIPGLKQNAAVDLPSDITVGGATISALGTVTSASTTSLAIGPAGTTNPVFVIDSSTGSQAAGLKLTGATAAGNVAEQVISSGSNASLLLDAKGTGTVGINTGSTTSGAVTLGNSTSLAGIIVNGPAFIRGSTQVPLATNTIAALGTTQNSTPTAAQLLGGIVTQTGATGAGTFTLPSGTTMSTAVSGVAVGDTFDCIFANLGGAQTITITGATGTTVLGTAAVSSGKFAQMTFINTGTNTWNIYCIVSA